MVDCGLKMIPSAARTILEEPITVGELLYAVQKGKRNRLLDVMTYASNF
jgi:hypothetical protein